MVLQELALHANVVVADRQHGDAVGLLRRALAGAVCKQLLLEQHERLLRVLQRLSVPPQLGKDGAQVQVRVGRRVHVNQLLFDGQGFL